MSISNRPWASAVLAVFATWWLASAAHAAGREDPQWVVLRGEHTLMNGSIRMIDEARAHRRNPTEPLAYVQRGGARYVIRDPATLAAIEAAFAPQQALGAKMTVIGDKMSGLGAKMASLGAKMGAVGMRMAGATDRERDELRAEMERLQQRMERYRERMQPLSTEQDALSREMTALGLRAQAEVVVLFDRAIANKLAVRV